MSFVLNRERLVPSVEAETPLTRTCKCVCVSPLYSLLLLFCVRVSSSELEPEPMDELSWLSGGQVRKPSPDSDREGVRVRERILSRLFGLISFLIFKVIQLPRLPRTGGETQDEQQHQKESHDRIVLCVP